MLYPLHLLTVEPGAAPRVQTLQQRAWRSLLLVPRQLCMFEAVACAEVRWFELPGFVRLQVQRLSPFSRSGASALRQGGRLMLWIWDADEVDSLIAAAGADTGVHTPVAEAMYLDVPADGEPVRRCTQSSEQLHVQGGAILQSRLLDGQALILEPLRRSALGHDWASAGAGAGLSARLGGGVGLFNRATWLAALVTLGWASYQGAALWAGERAVLALESTLAERMSDGGAQQDRRRGLEADQRWVQDYARMAVEVEVVALLEALRPVLEQHGVVIREWSSAADSVKLVLASAGGEIRLPELTRDLGRMQGIAELQLLQHEDLATASYAFRPTGWLRNGEAGMTAHGGDLD